MARWQAPVARRRVSMASQLPRIAFSRRATPGAARSGVPALLRLRADQDNDAIL
jgi:hypothetical protein